MTSRIFHRSERGDVRQATLVIGHRVGVPGLMPPGGKGCTPAQTKNLFESMRRVHPCSETT